MLIHPCTAAISSTPTQSGNSKTTKSSSAHNGENMGNLEKKIRTTNFQVLILYRDLDLMVRLFITEQIKELTA